MSNNRILNFDVLQEEINPNSVAENVVNIVLMFYICVQIGIYLLHTVSHIETKTMTIILNTTKLWKTLI